MKALPAGFLVFFFAASTLFSSPPAFCPAVPDMSGPLGPVPPAPSCADTWKTAHWNVHAEVLMIALPQEKLLPMLPDLRNPEKIDAAVEKLLDAVQRKEAILTGWPMVNTFDDSRGVSECILEKRYPTEFEPPQEPATFTGSPTLPAPAPKTPPEVSAVPTAFETRNAGPTLEVEPYVSTNGETIRLNVVAQRVELLAYEDFGGAKTRSGLIVKVGQPQFFAARSTAMVAIPNGRRALLQAHPLAKPENYMEVFILQASASAIK
jgi:hypothetical protein